jgi:hypothetical protein
MFTPLFIPTPPQNYQDVIQDALRIIAYSMEAHNWELVTWFLTEHGSPDLGAYFLPIIAQVCMCVCVCTQGRVFRHRLVGTGQGCQRDRSPGN